MVVKLEQLESDMRRLTGAVEELQYRNQQLEQALRALQGGGAAGAAAPAVRPGPAAAPAAPPAPVPGRRSDVFDPAQNPNAPGAPRVLGSPAAAAGGPIIEPPAPIPRRRRQPARRSARSRHHAAQPERRVAQLAPCRPRRRRATSSTSPTATCCARTIRWPSRRSRTSSRSTRPIRWRREAQFWLGESLFQSKSYQSAAEAFVTMTKKYPSSAEAARHAAAARPVARRAAAARSRLRDPRRDRQEISPCRAEREGGGRARTEACPLLARVPAKWPGSPTRTCARYCH